MNYYEHHLGDYLRDTAHLSILEDGVYRRLLDAYYIREAPLPAAIREIYRLVRAASPKDREAADTVLAEFFDETPDGWRHSRCDREIARFQDKQRKAKASADARWSHRADASGGNANASASASPSAMRTHSDGNAGGMHRAPVPSPQSPDSKEEIPPASRVPPSGNEPKDLLAKDLVAQGVDPKHARDWLRIRKAKKAPLTPTAWDAVQREAAAAGMTPAQAVKHAAESNWQGFKAAWLQRDAGGKGGTALTFRERDAANAAAEVAAWTGGRGVTAMKPHADEPAPPEEHHARLDHG